MQPTLVSSVVRCRSVASNEADDEVGGTVRDRVWGFCPKTEATLIFSGSRIGYDERVKVVEVKVGDGAAEEEDLESWSEMEYLHVVGK
ncbi:hypothetical protein COLO4_21231 [Corchorus olitorius]|uniref:Uncharacterized protein n=1 Tax=Corchorus olitorius TaxID=93759 RepID=A0A1R3IUT6_9ROSI|nr:hypothetical protein COLO4_21231 [Corchorus olitorius]